MAQAARMTRTMMGLLKSRLPVAAPGAKPLGGGERVSRHPGPGLRGRQAPLDRGEPTRNAGHRPAAPHRLKPARTLPQRHAALRRAPPDTLAHAHALAARGSAHRQGGGRGRSQDPPARCGLAAGKARRRHCSLTHGLWAAADARCAQASVFPLCPELWTHPPTRLPPRAAITPPVAPATRPGEHGSILHCQIGMLRLALI